jgi:hypothetical protein
MIRRDFVLRSIQQMTQVLARVLHLKDRQEYEQALREVGQGLREFGGAEPGGAPARSLEDWIALCRKHPDSAGGLMLAVADLLTEQGELFLRDQRVAESAQARALGLGLLIEALLKEECFVTVALVAKVDTLIEQCRASRLPSDVVRRLVAYHEARGQFANAEDALYDWLETGDVEAPAEGLLFYERITALSDASLANGGFSRPEVGQGLLDWQAAVAVRA